MPCSQPVAQSLAHLGMGNTASCCSWRMSPIVLTLLIRDRQSVLSFSHGLGNMLAISFFPEMINWHPFACNVMRVAAEKSEVEFHRHLRGKQQEPLPVKTFCLAFQARRFYVQGHTGQWALPCWHHTSLVPPAQPLTDGRAMVPSPISCPQP